MSATVRAFEAKTHLSELLARVEAGEQVTITKHGRPIARLVPVADDVVHRDWASFWGLVDSRLVTLPAGTSVEESIESGRL